MRKLFALVPLALALAVIGWLVYSTPAQQAGSRSRGASPPAGPEDDARTGGRGLRESASSAPTVTTEARRKGRIDRDRMRRRILDALEQRQRRSDDAEPASASGATTGSSSTDPVEPTRETDEPSHQGSGGDGLIDRTGGRLSYLTSVMNDDLMPLADECYALATEANPDLVGMLVLDLELIGDEDVGGVIESVTPGVDNELADADLLECMRESILSTTLPPPADSGRESFALSLRLGEE